MPLDIPLGTETTGYTVTIDGRTYRAFLVDAAGHLQADVLSSGLPSGAATLAEQQTQTTALQLIDDLRNALAAVAADELRISEPRERTRTMITQQYAAGSIAPHATTDRWSYTVPAGTLAIVEVVQAVAVRDAAASTARIASGIIEVTPFGVSAVRIVQAIFQDNTVGARGEGRVGLSLLMAAGDVIKGQTEDQSTGGSCTYIVTMKATEFAA